MQIDFLNPRSIICLIAILQGLVFSVLLAVRFRRTGQRADLCLAALLFTLCMSLVTPMIGFANVYDLNQWLTYFPFAIAYSYGVLVWLYTVFLTDSERRFARREFVLLIPAAIYLAVRFFLFAHSVEWKNWFDTNYGQLFSTAVYITELVWNLTFLTLAIRHYRRYRVWLDENYSDTERIKFDWLRIFLYVSAAVLITGAVFDFIDSFVTNLSYIQYFYFQLGLALLTYCLAVAGYLRTETIAVTFSEPVAERRTPVAASDAERLKSRLEDFIERDRPYLDPQLTLNDLARGLGVNPSALSFTINNGFGVNFNDFVNRFRVEEVKRRLADSGGETLIEIAFESGFNSKATFNRAFKKFTGASPTDYVSAANREDSNPPNRVNS